MRTIRFRGKVKYNGNHLFAGDWVFGSLIIKPSGTFIYVVEEDEFGNIVREFETEVIPETVGQFTGLTDKNGTEIFEGAILKISWLTPSTGGYFQSDDAWCENEVIVSVGFMGDRFVYIKKDGKQTSIRNGSSIEIIGNIHDNPDLLK